VSIQLVWFKKDLRIRDHAPLVHAAERGPVICLYIYEPVLLTEPSYQAQHHHFLNQCLLDLDAQLATLGARLLVEHGDVVDVFRRLGDRFELGAVWSHEETGHYTSFQRDLQLKSYLSAVNIPWYELKQNGVVRRLKNRDLWQETYEKRMQKSLFAVPKYISSPIHINSDPVIQSASRLRVCGMLKPQAQVGGETVAQELLTCFLAGGYKQYRFNISSPQKAYTHCSRLSPHLAFGTVSIREVLQRGRSIKKQLHPGSSGYRDINAFLSRIHWRDHFIQKLEDEPSVEFNNFVSAYDGLREEEFNPVYFDAWASGNTGFPLIDACMRLLLTTGWLNFRMRALLVSFATYQLWLDWRPVALHLAQQFLDFEPGIHYPQIQMQSGMTGINTIRMYNPIKQQWDQDPDGVFVRDWIPELSDIPLAYLATPHEIPPLLKLALPEYTTLTYPKPITDLEWATQNAKDRIFKARQDFTARQQAKQVLVKHGSRTFKQLRPKF
jgi:deoxyribodipyrimidine photo-lyase